MGNVNIKFLAKELNLSTSTVSRALKDSYEISVETKRKVMALAKKLNYQPNPSACSLREQKTKTIAVVIPEISNNFFALAINGIEKVARENNYHLLIYLTHENQQREITYFNTLSNGRVDGVLLSMSIEGSDTSHLEEFNQKGIPLVFFDRVCSKMSNTKVTTDDYDSSYLATKHLIEAGCKNISFLMISKNISIGKIRMNGYLDAIKAHTNQKPLIIECTNNYQENYQLIKNIIIENKTDGIFSSVEYLAIECYNVCKEINLKIPDDIKIISFSNLQTAHLLNPSLTTIAQPAFDMGEMAAKLLLKQINGKDDSKIFEPIILKSKLIIGKSTSVISHSNSRNRLRK
ncbi:MAG: LacI family DNA-binding transcriptional regulator [Ginsengibacter sp.]